MDKRLCIFICHTFLAEARAVLTREGYDDVAVFSLPAMCDGCPGKLDQLCDTVSREAAGFTHVAVVGCQSWGDLKAHLAWKLEHVEVYLLDECFDVLLNGEIVHYFLRQGAYLLPPNRLSGFKNYVLSQGFSVEQARAFYGESVNKLLVLDSGICPDIRDKAQEVSDFLQLPYEIVPVGLSHISLLLRNVIMRYRIAFEKEYTNLRLAQITRQTNDYSLVFDQIENLVRLRGESDIVQHAFLLFSMLFAPANIAFIPAQKSLHMAPVCLVEDVDFLAGVQSGLVGSDGFRLEVCHHEKCYGCFVIGKIAFPEYIEHYKSLSHYLSSVIGLSFANAALFSEVSENQAALKESAIRLEALNATKDKLFSIIAHDLINPFNAMIGLSSLLIGQFDVMSGDKKIAFLNKMNQSARDTLLLLQNLLKWAQSQSGQIVYSPEWFDISSSMHGVRNLLLPQSDAKNIRVEIQVESGLQIYADREMLQTVIRNLITNAIKFSQPGGMVTVSVNKGDDAICLSVQDSGVGIDAADIPNIWSATRKSVTRGTQNETGSGLGLVLCKEFVEKHGGSISVHSEVGVGTEFVICLPIEALASTSI